jgi:3-hydroxyisobutyrate dehydrogenase-like beta-hydroxyacid dehydrogenase
MTITTVGLLSPGDMGSAIGATLLAHGLRVLTYLGPRSERTRALARQAGIEDVPSLETLVREVDAVLSVLVPARALDLAREVAGALRATGAAPLYVDCNAIAPRTVRAIGETILAAGGRFADAGIIGPPPRKPGQTRLYTSGPGAAEFATLTEFGLDVRVIDGGIGAASGLKMCYGALTKGLQALGTELLVAAERMGLTEVLRAEQRESIPDVLGWLERGMPTMPPKAHRWVGEMEEIAACFGDLGLTPRILLGAADMYRFIAGTPIGQETPETRDTSRGMDGVVAVLSEALLGTLPAQPPGDGRFADATAASD